MNNVPIVFIHFNRPSNTAEPFRNGIFKAANKQALQEGNEVHLISNEDFEMDDPNFFYSHLKEHWSKRINNFQDIYENLSTNDPSIELICFLRWFILLNFMEKNDIPIVFHSDTDVMIYADVTEDYCRKYNQFDMTLIHRTCGSSSFITLKALKNFCDYLFKVYENKDSYEFTKMKNVYLTRLNFGLHGGVCDMTLLENFHYQSDDGGGPCRIGEMMHVSAGSAYDHNFNVSDGVYNHNGDHKDVKFYGGKPYCYHQTLGGLVLFNCLHLQGGGKKFLNKLIKQQEDSYEEKPPANSLV
jgi:hypothetical protein